MTDLDPHLLRDGNDTYEQRLTRANRAYQNIPTPDTAWGLHMKRRIATYYHVNIDHIP